LALTEAWYSGVPTVATPVGAVPELEERFGQLTVRVPTEPSAAELAEGVKKALAPENRAVVERARAVTREHFTAAAMGRRWSEYLLKLVGVQAKAIESAR
jgi:glycosyltransferase involved in cell wall biosynthesis